MYVTHSGWNEKHGAFHYDVFIDENKIDYEAVIDMKKDSRVAILGKNNVQLPLGA